MSGEHSGMGMARPQFGGLSSLGSDPNVSKPPDTELSMIHDRLTLMKSRLSGVHGMLSRLVSNMYGEGEGLDPQKQQPHAAGVMNAIATALEDVEAEISRIEGRAERLGRHA